MFKKILIANRGEIAIRIIRACHELGITAVAVYSEVDSNAMHVREADEAYLIGTAAPSESYLNQDVILEIARKADCCAVHPGYGFLAENAEFAKRVTDAGRVFIGSSPESIRLLGNKVESRKVMAEAGIPLTPGTGEDTSLDDETLVKEADRIGYPVMVKAASGGGGKGMRVVDDPADLKSSIEAARREAKAAFGDPTIFLERFVVEPRHIEFQVFGDAFGNRIHLFERECSIQRRHQKIIEETPSPALNDDLRKRMGETAVQVVEAANYWNAGTVEFLLDKDMNYYFLEVNTRIQVEHPVTEETVGVDLVKEQILVAAGKELSWSQSDLSQRGHAIEVRIYAEDAAANFLPSAGPVHLMKEPRGLGIRFDGGVESGDDVSVNYDPIIAKLIALAPDRSSAIRRVRMALDDTVILGLTTNIEFLKAVLDHPAFSEGKLHTNFIPEHLPDWKQKPASGDELALALALASLPSERKTSISGIESPAIPEPWNEIGSWEICSGGVR
ncbi:MAG: acetyl-CoA carboxylase biotin carboxylase subunit [Candidatus Hatepunaea meridiana]|nr:acetyl-CoA carboxylase biotin carboxylase subunit [Candidatus Hatepunaea meridiana]